MKKITLGQLELCLKIRYEHFYGMFRAVLEYHLIHIIMDCVKCDYYTGWEFLNKGTRVFDKAGLI
jgi:hypothetical protein